MFGRKQSVGPADARGKVQEEEIKTLKRELDATKGAFNLKVDENVGLRRDLVLMEDRE